MLISRRFFLVRSFPALQIPDLKTPPAADESDFVLSVRFFLQSSSGKTRRPCRSAAPCWARECSCRKKMRRSRAETAWFDSTAELIRANSSRRHDEQKLMIRLRQKDEFLSFIPSPARRNRDAILLVDGMAKFSGVEAFEVEKGNPCVSGDSSILPHLTPL